MDNFAMILEHTAYIISIIMLLKWFLGEDLKLVNVPSKIYHNGSMVDFPLNIINLFQSLQTSDLLKIILENFFNRIKPRKYKNF